MDQVKEVQSLIQSQNPQYADKFNRIAARWQRKLAAMQKDGKFSEYVEYSDKIKNHIARIRKCVNMQRGGSAALQQAQANLTNSKNLYIAIRENKIENVRSIF